MENNNKEREIMTTEEDIDEKNDTENNKNKKYDESRIYYVYKHVRLDNNTCFYIGKGKNGRKDIQTRNPTHDSICKEHGYKVVIFKDKLNEKEAFKLEEDLIRCYVLKMGYGICIKGYMNNNNKFLTNRTWGGEGTSGYKFSDESKQKIGEKSSKALKGKKKSEETKRKMSENHADVSGKKNPMYGKNAYAGKTKEEMEEIGKKISEKVSGENNPMAKKVICITTGKIFDCIKYAEKHYKCSGISKCCKGKLKHAGELNGVRLQWKYLEDDDNESKAV